MVDLMAERKVVRRAAGSVVTWVGEMVEQRAENSADEMADIRDRQIDGFG